MDGVKAYRDLPGLIPAVPRTIKMFIHVYVVRKLASL